MLAIDIATSNGRNSGESLHFKPRIFNRTVNVLLELGFGNFAHTHAHPSGPLGSLSCMTPRDPGVLVLPLFSLTGSPVTSSRIHSPRS